MKCFRLSKIKYPNHLSGDGAYKAGGRWNSKGIRITYTATSRALAMVELYVHISHNMIPADLVMITIDIPDNINIPYLDTSSLPDGWNKISDKGLVKSIGDQFINEGKHLALYVPSAVVKDDLNLLINPMHKDFDKISITEISPFLIDNRMFS